MDIVIIKPNDFSLDQFPINFDKDFIKKEQFFNKDKFIELIDDYIFIDSINEDNMMENIVKHIGFSDNKNSSGDTEICWQTKDHIYQICYMEGKTGSINKLATILTFTQEVIFGPAVLIKTETPINNNQMFNVSCNKDDIYMLLINKLLHYGVCIDTDNNFSQIIFNNEMLLLNQSLNLQNLKSHIVPLFKYDLIVYNDDINKINNYGTMINKIKTSGNIYITSRVDQNIFDDIDIDTVEKILRIIGSDNELTKVEQELERDEKNRYIVKSKYRILNNRYINYKMKCNSCDKSLEDPLYCSNCCRAKYCNIECQKNDWKLHKKICVNSFYK